MKLITYISISILMLIGSTSYSQLMMGRQVIGSTGSFASGTNITVSSTVGEAAIQTLSSTNFIFTQGFQQTLEPLDSIVDFDVVDECPGASNGAINIIDVKGCAGNLLFGYQVIVRPLNDTLTILSTDGLTTGDYNVTIVGTNGCTYSLIIFVGVSTEEDCRLKFYSGFTPNGDGVNDVWWIDNIDQFPENTVQIFNRWGQEVWYGENYDNTTVVWRGNKNDDPSLPNNKLAGEEMGDATYFYVARVAGIDKTFRGWIELTR